MIRKVFRRRRVLGLSLALGALAIVPSALAGVRIANVDASGFPQIRASIVADPGSGVPHLREDGRRVVAPSAVNLGASKAIVLALDRSQSMRGRPLAQAVAAGTSFVSAARAGDHVGVVVFGGSAVALTRFSGTPADARAALGAVSVDPHAGTALFDAVVMAASQLAGDDRPGRAIVVVTDGKDVSSSHSVDEAIAAAHRAHAAVYSIGVGGPSFTPGDLRKLALETGGSYRQASSAASLATVYSGLARELDRTWQVTYLTSARPGADLQLTALVKGTHATTSVHLPAVSGSSTAGASGLIPSFAYSAVGTAVVAALAGFLVLLAYLFYLSSRKGGALRSRIEPHLGAVEGDGKARRQRGRAAARTQVADVVERALGNLKHFRQLETMIERADLPLRAGELVAICAGCGVFVGLFAAVAALPAIAILLVMLLFASGPLFYVSFRAKARLKKFENQLPDLLVTIAASLKAGHSFRQGLQSVVDENAEPASKEFRRVLTETQLGKTMDDALADMAERVGSKNLTFVITAVTIQRQIGGSLAGLFDMVAETVRQRQSFLRKVRGLTAMGRMSSYVLIGLPFFIAVVVTFMNPVYMSPLWHTSTGQQLIATGLVMILVGSLMLKKIVSFRG